ncbi:MAG: hypothetical protein R3B06_03910 [Kofleriaceae bacterium]
MAPPATRPRSPARRASLALVAGAAAVLAATALHLLGASTAWLTPFNVLVSLVLIALTGLSAVGVARDVTALRIGVPAVLLGSNVALILAHVAGLRLVAFAAYPSTKFALTLAGATTVAAVGLVRRQMWARWLFLALGAAAVVSAGLNVTKFWGPSSRILPGDRAWSLLTMEQTWGYLVSVAAGLLIVANLAPIGARFRAGPSHAAWHSDATPARRLRWLTIAALVAVPMLLVYAWVQPVVAATQVPALVLAATLALAVAAAVRGKAIGALGLCAGGLGLLAQTAATVGLAPTAAARSIAGYYAVFWLPAGLLAVAAAAALFRPTVRLLTR